MAAGSVEQAVGLLREHGNEAKVLAGGQGLIPLLKLRFASPRLLEADPMRYLRAAAP